MLQNSKCNVNVNLLVFIFLSFFQYTLSDLLSKVQASEAELLEALKKIKAIEIDGGLDWLPSSTQINISLNQEQIFNL